MGILKSDFPAFEAYAKVKEMQRIDVIEAVKASGLKEYGVYNNCLVAEKWELVGREERKHSESGEGREGREGKKSDRITGALNNNDTEHMLLTILKENTAAVLAGLAIAAYAADARIIEIVIPKEDEELIQKITGIAKDNGIEVMVSIGMVDVVAAVAKNSVIHHIETAAAITALFDGSNVKDRTTVVALRKIEEPFGIPIEIQFGKTIAEIVGELDREEIKAIGIGSRVYGSSALDLVVDENLSIENGIITLFDKKCCMADQMEKAAIAIRKAGCGKCTFCREGAIQMHTMAKDITNGKGKPADLSMLVEIGEAMEFSCLCSIGQTGANFVLGALQNFAQEIEDHIRKKRCKTEVCSAFMSIYIDPSICDGCGDCIDVCEAEANCIEGKSGYIHMIDEFDCTKCGKCIDACLKGAVMRTTGRLPKLPERLTRVGRFNKR